MPHTSKFSINLESLIDLSGRLNETFDAEFILNSTLLSLIGKLKYLRASILIPHRAKLIPLITKGKPFELVVDAIDVGDFRKLASSDSQESILKDSGFDEVLPIFYRDEVKAYIIFGKRFDSEELNEEELKYIRLVSQICGNALKIAENHSELVKAKSNIEKRNLLLTALFEIGNDFSSLLSREQILRMLSFNLMGHLMVSRFAVYQKSSDGTILPIINRFAKEFEHDILTELFNLTATKSLSECQCQSRELLTSVGIKIVSPMIVQGDNKGVMLLGRKMSNQEFTDDNLQFISALSNTSIASLENERLFREELAKKRLESELEFALEIQKNLLPKEIPQIPRVDIYGTYIPSLHVGGDYFDIIPISHGKVLTAIADVSGKGMPASLLMANVQAALRVLAPLAIDLEELVQRINNLIYQNTSADKFVTCFVGIIDPKEMTYEYINAGHNPPIHISNSNGANYLSEGGLILGVIPGPINYSKGKVMLNTNDRLILYTDGVTEAHSIDGDEFGDERLIDLISTNSSLDSKELTMELISSIRRFADENRQFDDITVLSIRITS